MIVTSDVIEVSAGNFISMFCADGTVWVSGNGYGTKAIQLLNQDDGVTGVTDIFAGKYISSSVKRTEQYGRRAKYGWHPWDRIQSPELSPDFGCRW